MTTVVERRRQTYRRDEHVPPSRNWVLAWVVTVVVLILAVSLVILRGDRVDEDDSPTQYPGVVSAENLDAP